jgi:hypothetical protein
MYKLNQSVTWKKLDTLAANTGADRIANYFAADVMRFDKMSLRLDGLFLDYSKNRISDTVFATLMQLAEHSPLHQRRAQMFSGDIINVTENRPVLHTALRNRGGQPVFVNGEDVMPDIEAGLKKLKLFSDQVRQGRWLGYTGKAIRNIVNIGIGGSDLGPNMVCRALLNYQHPDLGFHFISNVDGQHIKKVLKRLDPATTLFIVNVRCKRGRCRPSFRRRVHQQGRRDGIWHSSRLYIRVLGLGRWPLLAVVEHRPADRAEYRLRSIYRIAGRRLRDGSAFPVSTPAAEHAGNPGVDRYLAH